MKIFPCEECLTFSICRNRYIRKTDFDRYHLDSVNILYDCSIFREWYKSNIQNRRYTYSRLEYLFRVKL